MFEIDEMLKRYYDKLNQLDFEINELDYRYASLLDDRAKLIRLIDILKKGDKICQQ